MENKNDKNVYPPEQRDFLTPSSSDLVSQSPAGDFTSLPNNLDDPIVSNNIATAEFSYIDNLFDDADL